MNATTYLTRQEVRFAALALFAQQAWVDGGGTMSLRDGTAPKDGYMVAPKAHERIRFDVHNVEDLTIALVHYVDDHSDEIAEMSESYLGVWCEAGVTYMDLPRRFYCPTAARAYAVAEQQIAYWDVANATEITTPKEV